ncbi:biotin-dependent carboxyltransferase family protein [Sciscionella sediminilitoris]|uniref:5-oxoprolinase subunit C family protein n=1 Tax=Sciscionella sediminilitoris TaxID=1445613 RepID=UPI00068C715E|nr:biotin-dependent carboxyltransferase family protein [Sciscionella sp. SE31]
MNAAFTVLQTGPLTTVQDTGRTGYGALGIGPSGACDSAAHRLANRLVGNDEGVAVLETTFGGLHILAHRRITVALTGAPCRGVPCNAAVTLAAGQEFRLGMTISGVRSYLAVRGGLDVAPVLGSRSTDLLGGLGPATVAPGDCFTVGEPSRPQPGVDFAPVPALETGTVRIGLLPGPRIEWFTAQALRSLVSRPYTVTVQSNRTALRLDGPALDRAREGELPSEGLTRGAIQVPPSGLPILFLADHPVTGGYPVIGYVGEQDVDRCAQIQPGQSIRFHPSTVDLSTDSARAVPAFPR